MAKIAAIVVSIAVCMGATAWAGPALLFEVPDGKVLYAEDQDDQWHPASLTKIMTAYVVFEALRDGKLTLASPITCSEHASRLIGPRRVVRLEC